MTLRLPRVWPPFVYLTAALTLHAATVGGIYYWCVILLGRRPEETDAVFARMGPVALLVAATAYGVFRVWAFHPSLRPGYRRWLEQVSWVHPKPRPLGPVELVAADALLLGGAVAATWPFYGPEPALGIVRSFLATYLVTLLVSLFVTKQWAAAYATWFGLGTLVLSWGPGWPFFAAAAGTYAVGRAGLRRALAAFPWPMPKASMSELLRQNLIVPDDRVTLGWPFGYLGPRPARGSPWRLHGPALAFLGGWTVYVALAQVPTEDEPARAIVGIFPFMFVVPVAVVTRFALYQVMQLRPPLSLAGRVATGRWIIPGYDRVLVAPILAVAVSVFTVLALLHESLEVASRPRTAAGLGRVAVPALYRAASDPALHASVAVGLVLLIALTVGPSHRRWLLTGTFRIRPGPFGQKDANWV
jgi:hypothetical protein